MKKILACIVAIVFAGALSVNASAAGFLVKGGLNYTHIDLNQSLMEQAKAIGLDPKSYSGFHFGVGFQTPDLMGFTLQPELLYTKKGMKMNDNLAWSMNYLEVPVNVQWGIDLVAVRPFVQVSPYVGYSIKSSVTGGKASLTERVSQFMQSFTADANRFSYGIGIGGGIEIMRKLQVSAKYVWNFGQVGNVQEFIDKTKNISRNNAAGVEVSVALMF